MPLFCQSISVTYTNIALIREQTLIYIRLQLQLPNVTSQLINFSIKYFAYCNSSIVKIIWQCVWGCIKYVLMISHYFPTTYSGRRGEIDQTEELEKVYHIVLRILLALYVQSPNQCFYTQVKISWSALYIHWTNQNMFLVPIT